jgi:hypothetical protein
MHDRTVNMHLSSESMIQIAGAIGTWDKLWGAIGYLAAWNLTYPYVSIYHDGGADLVAVYGRDASDRAYVIGAVWHDDHYGFHS